VALFYPDVAARLDFGRVTFLDKEVFTDVPQGSRREPDFIAQTYTLEGEPEFPFRVFEYYMLLRLRFQM